VPTPVVVVVDAGVNAGAVVLALSNSAGCVVDWDAAGVEEGTLSVADTLAGSRVVSRFEDHLAMFVDGFIPASVKLPPTYRSLLRSTAREVTDE
jgi:hypothetical protein